MALDTRLADVIAAIGADIKALQTGGGGASPAEAFLGGVAMMRPGTGEYIGNLLSGTLTTQAMVANAHDLAPYLSPFDFTIDQLGLSVSTAVAGSLAKITIYGADTNGRPTGSALFETLPIDCATVGTKLAVASFTFEKGRLYWIGVRTSAAQTLRVAQAYSSYVLSWTNAATPVAEQVLRKSETFAVPAGEWTYAVAQHTNARVPLVLMRLA